MIKIQQSIINKEKTDEAAIKLANDRILFISKIGSSDFVKYLSNYRIFLVNLKSDFENKRFFERTYLVCRSSDSYVDTSDKDLENEFYEINQGDVIKLGRLYLKIRELVIDGKIINKQSNIKKNILNRLTTNHSFNFNNNKKKLKNYVEYVTVMIKK